MNINDLERELRIIQENNTMNESGVRKAHATLYQTIQTLQYEDEVDQATITSLHMALAILNTAITHCRNITDRLNRLKNIS